MIKAGAVGAVVIGYQHGAGDGGQKEGDGQITDVGDGDDGAGQGAWSRAPVGGNARDGADGGGARQQALRDCAKEGQKEIIGVAARIAAQGAIERDDAVNGAQFLCVGYTGGPVDGYRAAKRVADKVEGGVGVLAAPVAHLGIERGGGNGESLAGLAAVVGGR